MRIGKREQLVGIGIAGLITIGSLHFFVFSPRAAALKTAFTETETLRPRIEGLKMIANQGQFNQFKTMTEDLRTEYDDVVTSLSLSDGGIFQMRGTVDEVVLDPPPVKGTTPDEIKARKQKILTDKFFATSGKQIDAVLAQIRKLRGYLTPSTSEGETATEFIFLTDPSGWGLITSLPPAVYSPGAGAIGPLVDVLSDIAQTQGLLKVIPTEQEALYARQRNAYEQGLIKLGLDNSIYRDNAPGSLAAMGEYVPLIHKLAFALLVQDAMEEDPDREIAGAKMTRDRLYEWLEINVPIRPLPNGPLGELYYVSQELELLDLLLELLGKSGVAQVFGVRFDPVSYLVAQPTLGKGDESAPAERETHPVFLSPHVLGGLQTVSRPVLPPAENDIGICIPVLVQFRASNLNAWKFIYGFLEVDPLAELDEVEFMGTPEGGGDVFCQVKFIKVLRLFQIFSRNKPPVAPTAGAAAAPAPAAAPIAKAAEPASSVPSADAAGVVPKAPDPAAAAPAADSPTTP